MKDYKISVGIVGTSWWADAMYLPALQNHIGAEVTAVCGRNRERAEALAKRWAIPHVYTDVDEMLSSGLFEALIIATRNDSHYPIAMKALAHDLHILCEKPLALTYSQAAEMAALATEKGVITMVPFTYRYMPTARYLKELISEGYIGRPYHLSMRYYTGYARSGEAYNWRFDVSKAGSGALGDIASHFIYLAYWYFGEIVGVTCRLGHFVKRPPLDPDGQPYEVADDTSILILDFASGAQGIIHASTVAYEDTAFGQTHQMEFHGSGGTLYHFIDWDTVQRVSGAREGEGRPQELPVPERIWGNLRRDTVHHTYKDVFRQNNFMTRGFINAILHQSSEVGDKQPIRPDFDDGAKIQRIIEAAIISHKQKRWVAVAEVGA